MLHAGSLEVNTKKGTRMKLIAASDTGIVREINQDNYLTIESKDQKFVAFGVADGLGGHNAGEVASRITVEILKEYFNIADKDFAGIKGELKGVVDYINKRIIEIAGEDVTKFGMGTTLTVSVIEGDNMYVVHVGDTRCYKINDEGIEQVTVDHSLVAHMITQGEITKEEALTHPNRNVITNALGANDIFFVDSYDSKVSDNDIVLVCSDGLIEHVKDEEIYKILMENNLDEGLDKLIEAANEGGGTDNITVVLYTRRTDK